MRLNLSASGSYKALCLLMWHKTMSKTLALGERWVETGLKSSVVFKIYFIFDYTWASLVEVCA